MVERRVRVFAAPERLRQAWASLAAFVLVERSEMRAGKRFASQSWFIVSRVTAAERLAQMIQAHRGTTENKLHWVKDVVEGEDASLIQAAKPATFDVDGLVALLGYFSVSRSGTQLDHQSNAAISA